MGTTKKKSKRRIIGIILLVIGLVAIVAILTYEAVHYPWGTLSSGSADTFSADSLAALPKGVQLKDYAPDTASLVTREELPDPSTLFPTKIAEGDYTSLGILTIPKLEISSYLLLGTSVDILQLGVGALNEDTLPGEQGNLSVAGHRMLLSNAPFRYLDKLEAGDIIYILHEDTLHRYKVAESFVVSSDALWVTDPVDNSKLLTLITCTPVVTLQNRLIVRAQWLDSTPYSE